MTAFASASEQIVNFAGSARTHPRAGSARTHSRVETARYQTSHPDSVVGRGLAPAAFFSYSKSHVRSRYGTRIFLSVGGDVPDAPFSGIFANLRTHLSSRSSAPPNTEGVRIRRLTVGSRVQRKPIGNAD